MGLSVRIRRTERDASSRLTVSSPGRITTRGSAFSQYRYGVRKGERDQH